MIIDEDAGHELRELLDVPRAARELAWQERFDAALRVAPMVKLEDRILEGPDEFPYLVLSQRSDQPLERLVSVGGVAEECTERGLGVVIDPSPSGPAWVLHYGQLWSLREYDRFGGDPEDEAPDPNAPAPPAEREVMVGQPSERMLPRYARRVLDSYLRQAVGLAEPRVLVLVDPAQRPSRNLVFNVHPEKFRDPRAIETVLGSLSWFMPPGRGVLALSARAGYDDAFAPLWPPS